MDADETCGAETVDVLFGDALTFVQYKKGYRFSIDSVLLAGGVRLGRDDRVLDLGCGCGVVGLAIAHLYGAHSVVGLECQEDLAELARRNVERNQLGHLVEVITGDVRDCRGLVEPGAFDVVVCNPPYYPASAGRINPDAQRAVARHEIAGHLGDFLAAARYGLRPKGTTYLIYPAFRLAALLSSLAEVGMRPEWLQFVQPRMSQPATLVLCAARVGGSVQLVVRPPLAIHEAERHTPIVAELLAGRRVRYPGEPGGEWQ